MYNNSVLIVTCVADVAYNGIMAIEKKAYNIWRNMTIIWPMCNQCVMAAIGNGISMKAYYDYYIMCNG